jgi:hypothetical protein
MDTSSDYCVVLLLTPMRMIRTSERPSNAESQNVGLASSVGARDRVEMDKPRFSDHQLTLTSDV